MESLRPLLTTYAYNILGTLDEAKDVVQDAFVKFMQVDSSTIEDKKAYLVRAVINHSINQKKRQKKIVANYPGQWLPEPVATEAADTLLLRKEILSFSLMVLLEKLDAKQRAVFILKEAFDYDHAEIAGVLDTTEENSRKILSRAKSRLKAGALVERKAVPAGYFDKYLQVIHNGDTGQLEKLLTDDITVTSDGGGKATAFMKQVIGKDAVMALLLGLDKKFYHAVRMEQKWINHEPAIFYYDGDRVVTCQVFSMKDGRIERVFFIRNPDKLKSLENIS